MATEAGLIKRRRAFMNIAILGAGHMGSWLARELREKNKVAVYDRNKEMAKRVSGVVVLAEPGEIATFKPDLLINAASLQHTMAAFKESAPYLSKDCVVSDMASIKTGFSEYYGKVGARFVSVHPMFGPTFANMASLKEENVIVINESDAEWAGFFKGFFERLGLNIFSCSFEEHDRMMAYSLTLPFVSSMVFAACVDSQAVPGTTFRKHMTIAKGLLSEDDNLLAEVLFSPYSIQEVEKVTARLELLKHIIRQKDYEEAAAFFTRLRENVQ